ncbi:phosphoadenosine phosphosulfate reductase [Thiosulfatihalobacter marinus]|uniref:phosphoadenosine phosphosulfate reductase n=1 Tax=Thiosulfatihalobacter marinus TaxID=2792481 RepID=UPI0018D93406|nr:phosphoadenosine phosphosulfate reductase [Thiosulfatihalobacter marinus]
MQDSPNGFDAPMLGLARDAWLQKLDEIAEEHGHFQPLGSSHWATLIEDKPVLLVTFETIDSIQKRGDTGQPLGWELVRELGWSHLCILSDGDTWFRDPAVYAYFDRLSDDGFFEDFDRIVFYGAGSCGYAAAAFSVAAPGATVVVLQPQATLDPAIAPWDRRYPQARKRSFSDRYGYAPDMLEAASAGFVLYDPRVDLDAMHAALYRRPDVTLARLPFLGDDIESNLLDMQILFRILAKAGAGKLTPHALSRLWRARRTHLPYLDALLTTIERQKRPFIKALLCANVARRLREPRYMRKLNMLVQAAEKGKLAG